MTRPGGWTGSGPGPVAPVGFDLDLTLIDSRPAILATWTEVARETGTAIDLAAVDQRMGLKLEDEAAFWFPAEQVGPAAAVYRRHYVRLAPGMTAALPGAHESLAAVRDAGAAPVVITAKHPVSVGPSMQAAGLTVQEIFTLVHGPEKAAVLSRIRAAAYVGDTPADMMAARSAGTYAVGVPTGSFARTELLTAGAHIVLDSLREFPAWYAAFRRGPADPGPARR
ncbi:MAG TPA: HAD hydrolase-like protein [Streptosporangiaceae bacterium]|nr:HAD hydrolase-like protein [Streptosporangiaceae bacterium]